MRFLRWGLSTALVASCAVSTVVAAAGLRDGAAAASTAVKAPDLSKEWRSSVQDSMAQAEYQVSRQDTAALSGLAGTLQAPNRAQGIRTYFTSSGIRVVPRTEQAPSWTWGLGLTRYGFDGALVGGATTTPVASGNRVDYHRGPLTEWYLNDERGLEQGFTFTAPPPLPSTLAGGDTLLVDLAIQGHLRSTMGRGTRSIDFTTTTHPGTVVLRYGSLSARDATGRKLPATMQLVPERSAERGSSIRLTVAAAGAVYPVTIDPLALGPDWFTESNQGVAWYGYSVSTAGDVNADGFDDVIIGAHRYDTNADNDGKAFLYYGSATGLSTTAGWTAIGGWAGAKLGHSVARAGDVNADGYDDLIIGVPNPLGTDNFGWAYAYYGSATGPSTSPDWMVVGEQAQGWFGRTVRSAGDVNADGYDDVMVGAPHWDIDKPDEGRAYEYLGSATGLSTTPAWITQGDQAGELYGRWCGTAGDVNGDGYADVIVGAHFWDGDQKDEGRAFAFYGSASGLPTTADWTAEGNQAGAWFGRAVGTAGDVNADGYDDVIVGAPKYDVNSLVDAGKSFMYEGSATGLSLTANWPVDGDQANAWYGRRLASAGDVNGDGFADVIVGAPNYDVQGQIDGGKVYAYYGSSTGLPTIANWTTQLKQARAWYGRSVNSAGDVNGDGFDEVVIGAPLYDHGEADEGGAFLFYGSPRGLGPTR